MHDCNGVVVFLENPSGSQPTMAALELVGLGARLASQLGERMSVLMAGSGASGAAQAMASYAEAVFLADHPGLNPYNPETYLPVLSDFCQREKPSVFLLGHTEIGQDLAPRLSFSLGIGMVSDCVTLSLDGAGDLLCTRQIYGGNALVTYVCDSRPRIATVRNRAGEPPRPRAEGGEVIYIEIEPAGSRLKILESVREKAGGVSLEEATVVVSGGRGMGGPEGFEQLEKIATLLGGAVGASRPPCDSGWINPAAQVGITGKVVAPDLYLAVAISGSSQHLSGMSEAGAIIAVNRDPEAYIFKVADYGVVGDWQRVLPAFLAKLRELVEK